MRMAFIIALSLVAQMALAASPKDQAAPEKAVTKIGHAAPTFELTGADGKTYKLADQKGKIVVLEWFNKDCPYVRKFYDSKTMQDLQAKQTGKGIVWFTIISSAPGKQGAMSAEEVTKLMGEWSMKPTAVLLDTEGKVGKMYDAKTTPHMFVIDKKGQLAYMGAIDDRPSASAKSLDGAQNYVLSALAAVEKGEPVKTASTTPYGCSIKYQ